MAGSPDLRIAVSAVVTDDSAVLDVTVNAVGGRTSCKRRTKGHDAHYKIGLRRQGTQQPSSGRVTPFIA